MLERKEGMKALDLRQPHERVTNLLVICLPAEGLITGFEAGKWTIVGRFEQIEHAKRRLRRLMHFLEHLEARAFIIQEAVPRQSSKRAPWLTLVRFREPELYLDQSDAVEASEEALESWAAIADSFVAPSTMKAKPAPSKRSPIVIAALMAAAVVALIGIIAALQTLSIKLSNALPSAFTRAGGITMSIPDEHRAGWYVRVKIYPDKSVEIIDRFPAYARGKHWKEGDMTPEELAADVKRPLTADGNLMDTPDPIPARTGVVNRTPF